MKHIITSLILCICNGVILYMNAPDQSKETKIISCRVEAGFIRVTNNRLKDGYHYQPEVERIYLRSHDYWYDKGKLVSVYDQDTTTVGSATCYCLNDSQVSEQYSRIIHYLSKQE